LGGITYQQVFSASGADVQVSFSTDTTTQNKATWSANASFNSNSYFLTATTAFTASSTGTEPASLLERMGAEAFGWLLGLPQSNNPSDLTNVNTTTTSPSVPDINTVKVLYPSFYPD